MWRNKVFLLTCLGVNVLLNSGCRLVRTNHSAHDYLFQGNTLMLTSDGKEYCKFERSSGFKFTSDKVSYFYNVEDKVLQKDFDVSLTKVSYDKCLYYYAKEINNLFVLDPNRGTIQVYGSNHDGKGRESFSGHTFIGITPVALEAAFLSNSNPN